MFQDQSRLLSLSTELVLLVLEHLPNSALVATSRTSRRLHYVALPLYLSRHGIESNPAPRSLVLNERGVPALPGLRTALFITSIDDLYCKFQGPEELYFTWGVVQLLRFVYGLSSITRVSLNVGNIDTRWVDGLATAASDVWKPSFIRLLNTVLNRGCESLTVAHGHFLVAATLLKDGSRLEGPEAAPARTFLGLSLPRRKQPTSGQTPVSRPQNKLTSFKIHSNMLLSPPFYDWTLQTLHTSPLTSLSLRISGLPQDVWPLILAAISLPSLTNFAAETPDITFPALLYFLKRHPTITTLTLHPHFAHPLLTTRSNSQKKTRLLPRLGALGGSISNVAAFLSHLHADTAKGVRAITLVLPMHQRVFRPSDFDALGAQIVGTVRGQGIKPTSLALRFSVPYETAQTRWLGNAAAVNLNTMTEVLGNVETIAFSTDGHFAFVRWVMPHLPAWLGTNFTELREVRLSGDCVPINKRGKLVQSIQGSCPRVKSVVFQDQTSV